MLRTLKNGKLNRKAGIAILLLICIILLAFLFPPKTDGIGSAAKDPYACQIGGLMISLDKEIWDCEHFQVVHDINLPEIFLSSDSASMHLNYELENPDLLGNPCIQFEYFQFKDFTYEDFIIDSEAFMEEQDNLESYRKSSTQCEGYDAFIREYTVKGGNSFYSIGIGKGTCVYGITYISHESMYDDYFDEFMKAINSIHIKHF